MAYALHLITGSGDHYTFAFDGEPTEEEVANEVFSSMGEESAYIDQYHYDATFENSIDIINGLKNRGVEMNYY
jgi:hypothetical protein